MNVCLVCFVTVVHGLVMCNHENGRNFCSCDQTWQTGLQAVIFVIQHPCLVKPHYGVIHQYVVAFLFKWNGWHSWVKEVWPSITIKNSQKLKRKTIWHKSGYLSSYRNLKVHSLNLHQMVTNHMVNLYFSQVQHLISYKLCPEISKNRSCEVPSKWQPQNDSVYLKIRHTSPFKRTTST